MVESIGPKSPAANVQQVATATRLARAEQAIASGDTAGAALQLSSLDRGVETRPPVDAVRVAQLRKAVQDGTYKLNPELTALRMLSMQQEWKSK